MMLPSVREYVEAANRAHQCAQSERNPHAKQILRRGADLGLLQRAAGTDGRPNSPMFMRGAMARCAARPIVGGARANLRISGMRAPLDTAGMRRACGLDRRLPQAD
jgi:hypothetical protein